ncbi:MAG: TetR family transcriptional regulator, partial [Gemmatimonadetes bacterium]|nr:TetR/AcrR family transcriptional regulator [Gemmatimonadota bacterium]NIR79363.1 TetR/AcrR family transcriptional regulator [Gemmatimonadota bacterium]NIT88015.1 TetR/AcrR family transcriptional regulator [Gemmatimonadota bacterium]NIU31876.1 TetR/AcrR family transcriptional regulator [Gemmatimonadota bacterium]NIU36479.1 TetR family transcriptional regulator [Gemmatimonadota bacterium]
MARPREFDETQTLHRVLDVFWRKGYRQTSLEDLEDATGLHRGSLYNAFGDKRALYRKALDRYREWLTTDGPMAQLVGDQKGAETLRAFIGTFVRSLGDPGSPRGCFFAFA